MLKQCPACREPAQLQQPTCPACGYQYPIRFVEPTQVISQKTLYHLATPAGQSQPAYKPLPAQEKGKRVEWGVWAVWLLFGILAWTVCAPNIVLCYILDVMRIGMLLYLMRSRNPAEWHWALGLLIFRAIFIPAEIYSLIHPDFVHFTYH